MFCLDLKGLVAALNVEPARKYTVAVIDNAKPQFDPVVGEDFLWISSRHGVSTSRSEISELFRAYGIMVMKNKPIAVFHHHDFNRPYFRIDDPEGTIEYYEFSHVSSISYEAMCKGDAKLISHLLSKTFYKYEKVVLRKVGLADEEVDELCSGHWLLEFLIRDLPHEYRQENLSKEEMILLSLAFRIAESKVVADPKRYRPKDHDVLIEAGVPVDQYAIPALFPEVELQGTRFDGFVKKAYEKRQEEWQRELENIKEKRRLAEEKTAEDEKKRQGGELLPEDAKAYIESIAPSLGYRFIYEPVYPQARRDIAVIRSSIEDGVSYGFDIVYLVWRSGNQIQARVLIDTMATKDYLYIKNIDVDDSEVVVTITSGGSYSGSPWERTIRVPLVEIYTESEQQLSFSERLLVDSQGLSAFASQFPEGARPFIEALARQMARLETTYAGQQTVGERILSKYGERINRLREKYPGLNEQYLGIIAEVYGEELLQDTLDLLEEIQSSHVANRALHIFGEMAMIKNDSSLYRRLLLVLRRLDDGQREIVLRDERLEFQTDKLLEAALKDYE